MRIVALLAVLGIVGFWFVSCGAEAATTHEGVTQETVALLEKLSPILDGVTDKASAEAAVAEIQALGDQLAELQKQQKELGEPTAEQKTAAGELLAAPLAQVNERLTSLTTKPEALAVLADALTPFRALGAK